MSRRTWCTAAVALAAVAGCGAEDPEEAVGPPVQSWNVQAPMAPAPSYDFAADPQFSLDERFYLIAIDMDPVSGPGGNLELSRDSLGAVSAGILVDRGYLACDGAELGLSAAESIGKAVEFGGLTPAEARSVLNAAVTTLCPEYIDSGT